MGGTSCGSSCPYLMSMTWLTTTLGCDSFPSPSSYRKSLKSHTTAMARCQPFFTPVGLGTCSRRSDEEEEEPKSVLKPSHARRVK